MTVRIRLVWVLTLFSICLALLAGPATNAQTVQIHVSSNGGDRLTSKPDLQFAADSPAGGSTFRIDASVKHQTIAGFGASIMEAGLMTLNTLPAEKQEEVLRALFDAKDGAGYTAMKTPLAGTDFQSGRSLVHLRRHPGRCGAEAFFRGARFRTERRGHLYPACT